MLQSRQAVHQLELDDDSMGHAVFAMLDCEVDRFMEFIGLQVSGLFLIHYLTRDSLTLLNCPIPHLQLDRMVHVYRFPLDFSDAKELNLFLCDCCDMESTWDILGHMDTSAMSAAETLSKLHYCRHSLAIKSLHESCNLPYRSLEGRDPVHRLRDFDFSCESQPVCLLQSSPSLMISCDFGNGQPCEGRSRVYVRTDTHRRYVCGCCSGAAASNCKTHLDPLASWIEAEAEDADPGVFESYTFKFLNHHRTDSMSEDDFIPSKSISSSRIRLDTFCKAMENRVKCGEMLA
jgi:hypothetical protein